jgi:hypothetical protein
MSVLLSLIGPVGKPNDLHGQFGCNVTFLAVKIRPRYVLAQVVEIPIDRIAARNIIDLAF